MKMSKSLEELDLLIKVFSETIENEAKEKKLNFLTFDQVHQLQVFQEMCQQVELGNFWQGKNQGRPEFLMSPHPLTNLEMQKCCQKEPRFIGVYSRNNFPEIKAGVHAMNFNECRSIVKLMILSKCTACDSEKARFMKEQEAIGLLWS